MGTTLTAIFETRREAEMTVERLVQEHDVERTGVFVAADGDETSAGEKQAGSDGDAGEPSPEPRGDAPLHEPSAYRSTSRTTRRPPRSAKPSPSSTPTT